MGLFYSRWCNQIKISDKESSSVLNNQIQESDRWKFEQFKFWYFKLSNSNSISFSWFHSFCFRCRRKVKNWGHLRFRPRHPHMTGIIWPLISNWRRTRSIRVYYSWTSFINSVTIRCFCFPTMSCHFKIYNLPNQTKIKCERDDNELMVKNKN